MRERRIRIRMSQLDAPGQDSIMLLLLEALRTDRALRRYVGFIRALKQEGDHTVSTTILHDLRAYAELCDRMRKAF